MSFTSEAKQQICMEELDEGMARSQLSALFFLRARLIFSGGDTRVSFQSENASITKHVFQLLRTLYDIEPGLSVLRKMHLKKNNIYCVEAAGAMDILEDLGIMNQGLLRLNPPARLLRSEKNARAFLQGAFLAGGSCNHPRTSNYHLEISCQEEKMAQLLQKQMERFYLPARIAKRKDQYIVYLKTGEKIADFLRLCGASEALLDFEDLRIQRDFFNSITRLNNCEVANEMKSISAAKKQIESIERIEAAGLLSQVPEKVRQAMDIRRENPEASVLELCEAYQARYGESISKSGMKHRLSRIREIAAPLFEADAEKGESE